MLGVNESYDNSGTTALKKCDNDDRDTGGAKIIEL